MVRSSSGERVTASEASYAPEASRLETKTSMSARAAVAAVVPEDAVALETKTASPEDELRESVSAEAAGE